MSVNLTGKYLDGAGLSKVWEKVKGYSSSNYLPLSGGNISGNLSTSGTLSVTGEATFTNNVTAKGFKVGNQIGFLKANGTIDDTNYLPLTGGTTDFLNSTKITVGNLGQLTGGENDGFDLYVIGSAYARSFSAMQVNLSGSITSNKQATTKKYVDDKVSTVTSSLGNYLPLTGGTLTGPLTLTSAITQDTQATTKKYVDDKVSTAISSLNEVLKFKGSINSTSALPTSAVLGWVYLVSEEGTYAGEVCEIGDMIICTTASTTAPTWTIIQRNIPGVMSNAEIDSICTY